MHLIIFCLTLLMTPLSLPWATEVPKELKNVGIQEHLGQLVDLSLEFSDETGQKNRLESYFQTGRPVLLAFVYYECPNLCTFLLNGLVSSLKNLDWIPGKEFEIVVISINHQENHLLAEKKKKSYVESYIKIKENLSWDTTQSGWHFLTGELTAVQKITGALGFGFSYDSKQKQFAHSAAIFLLTPRGTISRYLYGIEFSVKDLKLALLEAADGKIGNVVDKFLLYCFRYDPSTKKYSFYLENIMKAGGATTVVLFGSFLTVFWRRQLRGNSKKRGVMAP